MAILDIRTFPDPVLREKAAEIKDFDDNLQRLIDDMAETMYDAPGIGLAANQVGAPIRLVVVDLQNPDVQDGLIVLANPQIVASSGQVTWEEGCLSIPDYFAKVKRFAEVTVRALDRNGKPFEIQAGGLLAVALQHEIDHLDGKLFVDLLGPITKDLFKRKWKKRLREEAV